LKELLPDTKITYVSEGSRFDINGIEISVPQNSDGILSYLIVNENTSILLPGNIKAKAEEPLSESITEVDVLKAPRHGNKGSCSSSLLEKSNPDAVIVSTGRKLSDDFKNRLKDYSVYSTKTGGDITVNCETGKIKPYKKVK